MPTAICFARWKAGEIGLGSRFVVVKCYPLAIDATIQVQYWGSLNSVEPVPKSKPADNIRGHS